MNYGLARRLLNRVAKEVDINPQGLGLDQIKALELTPEDWQLVHDIEVATKKRVEVLALVRDKLKGTIAQVVEIVKEEVGEAPKSTVTRRGRP